MQLRLSILDARLAVCRLDANAPMPDWVRGSFTSVTRTFDELSIVCDEAAVPDDVQAERGWRLLRVEGPIPFETTGVAAALVAPLAEARISVFLLATFDTDYLLLKEDVFERAIAVLRAAGHSAM
ncbi:MAG: ACT domain-containing protein [Acidobacteriota bacterium]|nr:ACT domain-containing protein [Acidobacteriota bacterium]